MKTSFTKAFKTLLCVFLISTLFHSACQRESSGQPITPPSTQPESSDQEAGGTPEGSRDKTSKIEYVSPLPLVPGIREQTIAKLFINQLERHHISQKKIDPEISKEAFRIYLKSLDPFKMYFYQSDVDEFTKKYEAQFADYAKQKRNSLTPAFDIYNRYLERVKERIDTVIKILDSKHDFTADEEIIRDKDLMKWAKSPEEAYDRWRKRIKDDILDLKSKERDKAKEREKAKAENKETPKESIADTRDPIERLKKRYTSFRKRMLLENHIANKEVLEKVKQNANDEALEQYLSAIAGALDPHTSYMSKSTLSSFETTIGKNIEGIGATLTLEDGYTVIKALSKGGPAEKSGELKVDDKIVAVGQGEEGNLEDIVDFKLSDVVGLIRGVKGTVVRLEVQSGGTSKLVRLVRDKVDLKDQVAKSEIFETGKKSDGNPYKVGVIDLPDFYLDMEALRNGDMNARSTTTDIKKILNDFISNNVDVVLLDLRRNGGGSLMEAIQLTGLFIETGTTVQTKEENTRPQLRDDPDPSCEWTGPLVVVTSKFSASASEIFSGAIRDYKRGLIVGDSRSHGKGTVQQMKHLGETLFPGTANELGAIKITIQGFYSPNGISPQREGVAADVVLPSFSDNLEGICESDLDNPLTLNKIPATANPAKEPAYVTTDIVKNLQILSENRIKEDKEFTLLQEQIENYKIRQARKYNTLNEAKYFEELDKLNEHVDELEEIRKALDDDAPIKRTFYMNELLNISIDYINELDKAGIKFPKERRIQKRRPLNFLFGT
ncbi:MAG: carboxy terminal-processing peptidase [Planctomycetaceae bacterium]|jgi:carboxyl-terminal processing protease|nr:carboxy terminal-processing peptidase [Planctomycetaceae bacterium]